MKMSKTFVSVIDAVERRGWEWLARTDTARGYMVHLMSPEWDGRDMENDHELHVAAYAPTLNAAASKALEMMNRHHPHRERVT